MIMLKPGKPAPALEFDSLDGQRWRLADQKPRSFTMVVFYRGLFCGTCQDYLQSLVGLLPEFESRGVITAAVSMDTEADALASLRDWSLGSLTLGYRLPREAADAWGLHIDRRVGDDNLEYAFNQPGLFLIRPDQHIYAAFVQTSEFARPRFEQVLRAIDFQLGD